MSEEKSNHTEFNLHNDDNILTDILINIPKIALFIGLPAYLIYFVYSSLFGELSQLLDQDVEVVLVKLMIGHSFVIFSLVIFLVFMLFVFIIYGEVILKKQSNMNKKIEILSKKVIAISLTNSQINTSDSVNSSNVGIFKCPNCGAKYNNGDKFCDECGTKLD